MSYLILVLAILVTRFSPHLTGFWGQAMFRAWHGLFPSLTPVGEHSRGRLYLITGGPVVAVTLILILLHSNDWYLLRHLLGFVVLLCAFGSSDLRQRIATYVADLDRNDIQAAYHDAARFDLEESRAANWNELHQHTLASISWSYFQCYFPVIFWFVVLGAPGAVLYGVIRLYRGESHDEVAKARLERLLLILEWLPLRVFGLTLALVGNWQATYHQWLASLRTLTTPSAQVLTGYILAAIHGRNIIGQSDTPAVEVSELAELPSLVDRALITWIAILGIVAVL